GGDREREASAASYGKHSLLAHSFDSRAEEGDFAAVRPQQAVDDAEEHRLARPAPTHHGQRGATVEIEADPPQHLVRAEGFLHLTQLDEGRSRHRDHQNRIKNSFVRKKSETMTPMATWTTVSVVERPSPSVPPSVASPL